MTTPKSPKEATDADKAPPVDPTKAPSPPFEFNREQHTFTAGPVVVYKRVDNRLDGALVLGPDKQPVPERTLGSFTFKVPTMDEFIDIGIRRASRLRGVAVDGMTAYYTEALAALPLVVLSKPDEWAWDKLYYPKDMGAVLALFEAYNAGLEEF